MPLTSRRTWGRDGGARLDLFVEVGAVGQLHHDLAALQGVVDLLLSLAQVVDAGGDPLGGGGDVVADPFGEVSVQHCGLCAQPDRRRGGRGGQLAVDGPERQGAELVWKGHGVQRLVVPDGGIRGGARQGLARCPGRCRAAADALLHREQDPEQRQQPDHGQDAALVVGRQGVLSGELELQVAGEAGRRGR